MLYVEYLDNDFNLKDIYFKNDKSFVNFFESDDHIVLSVYSFRFHDYIHVIDRDDFEILLRLKRLLNRLENFKIHYSVR